MTATRVNESEHALRRSITTILDTWHQGRKTLIVVGAGISAAADIPLMTSVYAELLLRLTEQANAQTCPSQSKPMIESLCSWLSALAQGNAPRSLAAMTLGTFQRAHRRQKENQVYSLLGDVWDKFSVDFIAGSIRNLSSQEPADTDIQMPVQSAQALINGHPFADQLSRLQPTSPGQYITDGPLLDRTPTRAHHTFAKWAIRGWAELVSVNFDGLTRKALDETLASSGSEGSAVVLSTPQALRNYFTGDPQDMRAANRIIPVIKVWGDVFHAVCTNTQCPECGSRVAIFQLPELMRKTDGGPAMYLCPSCHQHRQLQIFFTGYDEKEQSAQDLMKELLRFVAPQVGCVIAIGFSGLWDQALVEFIADICRDIERENTASKRANASCICIDPKPTPSFLQDMARRGISPVHVRLTSDGFASLFFTANKDSMTSEVSKLSRYTGETLPDDEMWKGHLKNDTHAKHTLPRSFEVEPPRDCRRLHSVRGWRHERTEKVFTGSSGAGGEDGLRPRG